MQNSDGEVVINVKVLVDSADKAAKNMEQSFKNVELDKSINKDLDDMSKSAKSAGKSVDDLGEDTDRTSKSVDKAKKAFGEEQTKLKITAATYDALAKANEKVGNKYSANVYKLKSYQTSLDQVKSAMTQQKSNIDSLTKKYGENSSEVEHAEAKYEKLAAEQESLNLSSKKLAKSYGALTPEMAKAADKTASISTKFKSVGSSMTAAGDKMSTRFTLPIMTGLGYATKSAIDFESQIQSMGSLLNDGTVSASTLKKQLENLGNASKKWSTQYGVSTTKINSGMEELIKKGYSYNQVLGAMPSLLNASRASGDDFNKVMSVSTSTLEQFGLKSNNTTKMLKNTQRVTDGLTFVANKTSAGFEDMGYAMEYVGPVAHGLKMSLEQTASAIGLMSNQGIEGQKAGTALRGALSALLTPSKQNMIGFQKLGVSVDDFKKGTLTLPDILDNIKEKSKGMTKQQLQSNLALAFGTEAQTGMNVLVNEGGDALRNLTGETKNATGYTKKLADTMNQTSQANAQKLKESLHVLAITAGQELVPDVNDLVKELTGLLKQFNNLDDGTKKMIINTALVVAAGGPALSMLGRFTSGIGSLIGTGPKMINFLAKIKNGTKEVSQSEEIATKVIEKLGLGGKTAAKGVGEVTKATAEAGKKTGIFRSALSALLPEVALTGGSLSALLLPIAGVTAGIAAIAAVSYFAIKAHNEEQKKIADYRKSLDEYGVNVDKNTKKAMKSFNDLRQSATNDMAMLDTSTNDQSKKLSSDVVAKYDKMAGMVTKRFTKMKTDSENTIKSLNSDLGDLGDKLTNNVTSHIDDVTGNSTKKVKDAQKTIHTIYKQVGGDLSQMNATQKRSFEDAQNLIAEQTSAFAVSLSDQQALLNAYKEQHGNITTKMYREDVKKQKDAHHETYETAKKARDKELAQLKKDHQKHLITDKQYQDESSVSWNKYQSQMTKSNITYAETQKATYKHFKDNGTEYLATKQSIWDADTSIDAQGQKTYKSVMSGMFISRKAWLQEAKDQNKQFIDNQQKTHGTVKSNLDKYYKNQVKFYEKLGLSRKQAKNQAQVDLDDMKAETDKTVSNIAADAENIQKSYLKGLQSGKNGSPAQVASKWGLDLTNTVKNINLGKYGKKSAKQLWDDFQSGSKEGQEEAKIYYLNMFQEWKANGKTKIKDLTDDNKNALHEGLQAGVISIQDLKGEYGKAVLNLFPKDMSQVPEQEIKSLKSAYKNKVISLDELKKQFGDKIYQLFPNDLSSLGKKEVSTLKDGINNGQINADELKAKFGPQIQSIFKKDLSDVGKDDIKTLQTALNLGITNKDEIKKNFAGTLDRIYNQSPELSKLTKENLKTLQTGLKNGYFDVGDIQTHYKSQLDRIYNQNLSDLGKGQVKTLANGLKLGLPDAQNAMKKIQGEIDKNATVDLKGKGKVNIDGLVNGLETGKISVSTFMNKLKKLIKESADNDLSGKGHDTIQSYADGINGNAEAATSAADNTKNDTESQLTPTEMPYQHGSNVTTNFGQGILDLINNPLGNALSVHDQSVAQFAPDELANQYGLNKSRAFGQGILTNGGIPLTYSSGIAQGVNNNFNDGIDSGNNIAKELGGKASYKKHSSKTKTTYDPLHLLKTGTNGKLENPTPSIVGDGYEPELIDYGDGTLELSPDRPTFRMLNPGAQVFSGRDTKMISNALNGMGISMFANGTGGSVTDWISNAAKTSWDWIQNAVGDLVDWITSPKETWSKLVDKQFDSSGFTGKSAGIGDGTKATEKKQTNWLDKLIKDLMATGGSYDPAMILKAAAIMGVHPTANFVKMLQATIQSESGGRNIMQQISDRNSGGNEARGILQYVPGTFRYFHYSKFNDIMNPFHQLLAFFNNSDWANSIGPTTIWGTPKIDWLHSGPQGHPRMNEGGYFERPATIEIAEKHGEYVINPYEKTAPGLTNSMLKQMADVQPEALAKIKLPGQNISPESISGFKSLPMTQSSVSGDEVNSNNNVPTDLGLAKTVSALSDKFDKFIDALSGDVTVEIPVNGDVIAKASFPKMKVLMNNYINSEMTRRGR